MIDRPVRESSGTDGAGAEAAWWLLGAPALLLAARLGPHLVPDASASRPEVLIALVLTTAAAAAIAWNLLWLGVARLAALALVPRALRRRLAALVEGAGTQGSRTVLRRLSATAALGAGLLGGGLLSACSPTSAASPVPDDLTWGATTAVAPAGPVATPEPPPPTASASSPAPQTAGAPATPTTRPAADTTARPSPVPAGPADTSAEGNGDTSGEGSGDTHVVVEGECLWSIADDVLGRGATPADIAELWPLIHEENRAVIGPDPDLVLPGTVLTIPEVAR